MDICWTRTFPTLIFSPQCTSVSSIYGHVCLQKMKRFYRIANTLWKRDVCFLSRKRNMEQNRIIWISARFNAMLSCYLAVTYPVLSAVFHLISWWLGRPTGPTGMSWDPPGICVSHGPCPPPHELCIVIIIISKTKHRTRLHFLANGTAVTSPSQNCVASLWWGESVKTALKGTCTSSALHRPPTVWNRNRLMYRC